MADQYLRKVGLTLSSPGGGTLDLSEMRIRFKVTAQDIDTPPAAIITVTNLSDTTASQAMEEYSAVTLNAGYQTGSFGTIFNGQVIQTRRGKETQVTKYLEIFAADSDFWYTNACTINAVGPNGTQQDVLDAILSSKVDPDLIPPGLNLTPGQSGINTGYSKTTALGPVHPRGKVLFGMARELARRWAKNNRTNFSIKGGYANFIPLDSYPPGEHIVLNSETGMIRMPIQTDNGIQVDCLLNPRIQPGTVVQINEADIQTARAQITPGGTGITRLPYIAPGSGLYKVLVSEFEGDTRGIPWYNHLTCIAIDPADQLVDPYSLSS